MINQPWLAGEIPSKNEGLFLWIFQQDPASHVAWAKGGLNVLKVYLRGTWLVLNKAKIERPNVHQTWIDWSEAKLRWFDKPNLGILSKSAEFAAQLN